MVALLGKYDCQALDLDKRFVVSCRIHNIIGTLRGGHVSLLILQEPLVIIMPKFSTGTMLIQRDTRDQSFYVFYT